MSIDLLVGKTLSSIAVHYDVVYFECNDGSNFRAYHMQDCCENVRVWDTLGDKQSVIGEEILIAEESNDFPKDVSYRPYGSYTWTIHTIVTKNGFFRMRWLGESNGYYSESVYFQRDH